MNYKYNKRISNLSDSITNNIQNIDLQKQKWITGAELGRQVLTKLKKSVLITSTGSSTRIEGSSLSDDDVEKLMKGLSLQTFKDRDKQEVQGYFEILDNVFNSFQTIPFSENTIKFFHRELLKYTNKDTQHRGEYKTTENKIALISSSGENISFDTVPAWKTQKAMLELVEWTQNAFLEKKIHPLLTIGNFIVEFLYIHPFEDGNGRLSRILTNLLLLQHGYEYVPYISHEKYIEENKIEYYLNLRNSQKTIDTENEDISPWLQFFTYTFLQQSKSAIQLISQKEVSQFLSLQQERVWNYIKDFENEFTPIQISKELDIPRVSVGQSLEKLLKLKWIERKGLGRGTRYFIRK